MNPFNPYLSFVAALVLGILAMIFLGSTSAVQAPVISIPTASSTLSTVPSFNAPAILIPEETNTTATTSPQEQTPPVPSKKENVHSVSAPTTTTTTAAPVSSTVSPLSPSVNASLDASASALRSALVNIICSVSLGSGLHSISGSGVFIDQKGIILTNAHVAQYFLLTDQNVSCTIRSGSPAKDSYSAALIYISSPWLKENAGVLTESAPSGTGEYDFALLAVSKSAINATLPSSFPFVPLATKPPSAGAPVVIASYGAQFLESSQIKFTLFPTVVFGSIKDVFTFAVNTVDVLALGGSAAAQEGSSGGGVVDASGALVGTITTSTVKGSTDTRSLNAITASYIRAEYASETGSALDLLLDKSPLTAITNFAPKISELESILTAKLP